MVKKNRKIAIVMVGAPGSGKGTQGEVLEKNTGFKRYVTSDMIRSELKKGSELRDKVSRGILLDDSDIFKAFRKHFKSEKQVIIDGLPRTLDQAYWLYGFLVRHGYEIELVYLKVDESKLLKRIISRYYCPKCHRGYNTLTIKPKKAGVCDDDGAKLVQREDDTKAVFSGRLKTFDEVKQVILKVYSEEVIKINGDQDIDKVSQDLMKSIIVRE